MNYDLIHYFSLTRSREPELKLQYNSSSSGSGENFRLLAAPASQNWILNSSTLKEQSIRRAVGRCEMKVGGLDLDWLDDPAGAEERVTLNRTILTDRNM